MDDSLARHELSRIFSPMDNFLKSLSTESNRHLSIPIILAAAYMFRLVIGLGHFSGQGIEPMHGDFEAQRHWLELTQHLPLKEWYFYDLQYWGLDYPPVTAYHSWLLGKVGCMIEPSWFALDSSRGCEDTGLVVFMRQTVIVSDFLTYIPAVILFSFLFTTSALQRTTNVMLLVLQPALILIDHGHFQYNGVMLGFLVYSVYFMIKRRLNIGAIMFVLCLAFKQMGLYYSPAIFAFLLSKTYRNPAQFLSLAIITGMTFGFCFAPFALFDGLPGLQQVIIRMFPFGRGLFEDKVANFWCAVNVVYKLKGSFEASALQKLSLIATLMSVLPGSVMLFRRPTPRNVVLGIASSAWGFFLFSFQVHEKSVLLPLVPSSLLIFGPHEFRSWIGWINVVATFSLWPLLKKDKLQLQYFVFSAFWLWLGRLWQAPAGTNKLVTSLHRMTYVGILAMHILEPFITIEGKPDLWPVLNVLFCVPCFGIFYLWILWQMLFNGESRLRSE